MQIGTEADMLIQLMKAALSQSEEIPFPEDCEKDKLITLIKRHRLLCMVYPVIGKQKDSRWKEIAEALKSSYSRSIRRTIIQDHEIRMLLDAMEEDGMDVLPLKGWYLRNLYPDPTFRSMADFDVLFRDYDTDRIKAWMEARGYTADHIGENYHDNFLKKPFMNVETHRILTDKLRGQLSVWSEGLWSRCTQETGKKHIWRMSDEDFYIFLLAHMYEHFAYGGTGVRSVADIYVYLRAKGREMSRDYLNRELKKTGLAVFAGRMEKLTRIWFEGEAADPDSALLTDYLVNSGIYGTEKNCRAGKLLEGETASYHADKLRVRLNIIFPGTDVVRHRYPIVGKYPVLLPFFWVVRIMRVLFFERKQMDVLDFNGVSEEHYAYVRDVFRVAGVSQKVCLVREE